MPDIKKLKLTDEFLWEIESPIEKAKGVCLCNEFRGIADAQLAKALWGVSEQLEEEELCNFASKVIAKTLEAAGIPRPEKTPEQIFDEYIASVGTSDAPITEQGIIDAVGSECFKLLFGPSVAQDAADTHSSDTGQE